MYPTKLVDTVELLNFCLEDITSPHVFKLAVDLEGIDLGRNGTISLLQIFSNISTSVWVIDIFTIGPEAFSHTSLHGQSLKAVLENQDTMKMFWDVRNDSDALFSLGAVYDIQLLEVGFRRSKYKHSTTVKGLAKAVLEYVKPRNSWAEVKEAGRALLFPEKGGSYELFEKRPLDSRILEYAANDVVLLFTLAAGLEDGLGRECDKWRERILKASSDRVAESHQIGYNPNSKKHYLAPKF